jgi:hypothetical protein
VTTTLQEPIGRPHQRPSATDEHSLPHHDRVTVQLPHEHIAGTAQHGEVAGRSTAVGVRSTYGSTERSAHFVLAGTNVDVQ